MLSDAGDRDHLEAALRAMLRQTTDDDIPDGEAHFLYRSYGAVQLMSLGIGRENCFQWQLAQVGLIRDGERPAEIIYWAPPSSWHELRYALGGFFPEANIPVRVTKESFLEELARRRGEAKHYPAA